MADQDKVETGGDSTADAVENTLPVDGDESQSPTPSGDPAISSEQVAEIPEVKQAFAEVFGEGDGADDTDSSKTAAEASKDPTGRKKRAADEEQRDELEGLEGVNEADDGTEPEVEKESPETETEPDDQDAKTKDGEEAADDAPTLDPVLRQAAKRAGMTDDGIDSLLDNNVEQAVAVCQGFLVSSNDLSDRYAQLGRVEEAPAGVDKTTTNARQTPAKKTEDFFAEVYGGEEKVQELQEKYGEEFTNEVIKPLMKPVTEMLSFVKDQQSEAMASEVNDFFDNLPDAFAGLYGTKDKVDEDQFDTRLEIGQHADQIRRGARQQGIELPVREVLERAHLKHASKHMAETERKKLAGKVKKRSGRLTQRPTNRTSPKSSAEHSDEAATDAYAAKAAELGFDVADVA